MPQINEHNFTASLQQCSCLLIVHKNPHETELNDKIHNLTKIALSVNRKKNPLCTFLLFYLLYPRGVQGLILTEGLKRLHLSHPPSYKLIVTQIIAYYIRVNQ